LIEASSRLRVYQTLSGTIETMIGSTVYLRQREEDPVRIGIVGGTGNMGKGLALRLSKKHDIILGSRDADRAKAVAEEYYRIAEGFHGLDMKGKIAGDLNEVAIRSSDLVVVAVPPQSAVEISQRMKGNLGPDQLVVSTIVPMEREKKLFRYKPFTHKRQIMPVSGAEIIAENVQPVPVVSAFQTVPASYLADLDSILNIDVLVSGDNEHALEVVCQLIRDIPNLRPLRVGPLSNSRLVESITPLLLNAAILNNLRDPSIRIVPWLPRDFGKE
jgi:NADPH-dependent F420 reductase